MTDLYTPTLGHRGRYHVGDHVCITSDHPFRGYTGRIKWIGEVSGFYLEMDKDQLVTWAQHVDFAPNSSGRE